MASMNITTDKTRAQMVEVLAAWAGATKVSGNDYVWACTDDIVITAEIELYGFNLIFASGKRIVANAGGNIKVSKDIFNTFYLTTTLTFLGSGSHLSPISFVGGTGKWTGGGLSIRTEGRGLEFSSTTSQCALKDLTVDALKNNVFYLKINIHADGEINVFRLSGVTVQYVRGKFTMNPKGYGIVNGDHFAVSKLSGSGTFKGFTMLGDSTTTIALYSGGTMTFSDGLIDPDIVRSAPKNNNNVRRIIQRTITLTPSDENGANISGFGYRVSSNRHVMPTNVTTPNTQIITEINKAYGYTYLMNVWNAYRASGSASYGPMVNITSDKDMRVQYRKYGYLESSFRANSYNYAVDAKATLLSDTYIKDSTAKSNHLTTAAEFYDAVRSLVGLDLELPEDLFSTDGIVIDIKATWTLKRSATATTIAIDKTSKSIILDKDSYIAKYKSGKWDYTGFAGTVDATMDGHTNMSFPRTDGKANLTVRVTCPFGVEDAVVGVWKHSQGVTNRAGIISAYKAGVGIIDIPLVVSPTEKYYAVAKAHGSNMTSPIIVAPIGSLGATVNISVDRIDKATGDGLIPIALTAAQTRIANMFIFDSATNDIDIKLPTDYSTDSRWDGTNRIWQFLASDFGTIAFKIDEIQTTTTFIATTQRVFFLDNKMELATDVHAGILKQSSQNTTIAGGAIKVSFNLFSISQFGDNFQKNTFIDNSNGTIDVVGGIPLALNISAGLTPAEKAQLTAIKTEVDKIPAIKTKADETHQRLALDSTKPLTNKPDGGITSTGINIVATELADGSIKQTRS